jgi:hypothetical protein
MNTTRIAVMVLIAGCVTRACDAASPLVVHEWGTFTSFQDRDGKTIAGINVDDEPVPGFVHRLGTLPVFETTSLPATWSQGAPSCHPDVTLRLETPVLYFYPPADWRAQPFDVQATFIAGWLTEFYPSASVDAGRFPSQLNEATRGSVRWQSLQLEPGADTPLPQTTASVWLAPRKVRAKTVLDSRTREAEKYLFYRGVGHLDAPLVVRERNDGWDISLRERTTLEVLPRVWVVEVLPDGRVRHQASAANGRSMHLRSFSKAAGAKSTLPELQRELADAMVSQGLFVDEAAAMLATWKLSYFESAGLRMFFLLPQAWTDAQLPLTISTPARVTRVMVGRIELVTPHQRATLARLQALPLDAYPRLPLYFFDQRVLEASNHAGRSLSQLHEFAGREVPESLRLYESLGRFRDALMMHELQASSDEVTRTRFKRAIASYSACVPDTALNPAQLTSGQ